jgi:multidrug efflux pump subunit AcrB
MNKNNDSEKPKLITRFSLAFISRWRVSLLLLVSILTLGYFSYTSFLPRDGFPAIAFPAVQITTAYFVDDPTQFDQDIISPIEEALQAIDSVGTVSTSTDGQFGTIFVQFNGDITSDQAAEIVELAIDEDVDLPENSQVNIIPIKVGSIDNVSDLVFTLSSKDSSESYADLQQKAFEIVDDLKLTEGLKDASVAEVISTQVDPVTGQEFDFQQRFTRIGLKEDGELVFNKGVNIGVVKENGLSSEELSETVRSTIGKIESDGDLDAYNVTYIGDVAEANQLQIESLESNFLTGLLAVVLVLILFVNWRASIVTAIFIPTVLALTFIVMMLIGSTLNVISLFALVLALGLFVDDAIVVIEAIEFNKRNGLKGVAAVKKSINEIGVADVMGTLTTVLVFAPMLFISGILGDFISEMPRTIVIALLSSLFIALTITPFLSNLIIRVKDPKKAKKTGLTYRLNEILDIGPKGIQYIASKVSQFTHYSLTKKYPAAIVFVLSILVIIGGLGVAGYMFQNKFNPFPEPKDATEMQVTIFAKDGVTLEELDKVAFSVESVVSVEFGEEVVRYDYFESTTRMVFSMINLTDMGDRDITTPEMVNELNSQFENVENANVQFNVVSAGPPAEDFPLVIQVYSEDQATLEKVTNEVAVFLENTVIDGESTTDVQIDNLYTLSRIDGKRYAVVKAKLTNDDNTQLILDFQEAVKEEFTPEKLEELGGNADTLGFDLGQQTENINSLQSLYLIGMIAIVLMYGLLVWQFNSFLQPILIIFVALLLAFPGVFIGLYLTDNYVSFLTTVGMIGLIGIVVNNTIMLVDFANQARERGENIIDSISGAIKIRFRPLVTTTATTVCGLLPLALLDPFWEGIAFTIIFGLISSTTLVIFAFPVYYSVVEVFRDWKNGLLENVTEK